MGQGNPNKVNAIVDEIVKNNSVFKLKSAIEQDKEKESMAKSINTALSALNEVGKELVLQDLSVDPDEKFKGFIDSSGNVDISGLTQFTTTIVKEKIEEAKREGLDLRKDAPNVFRNNKTFVANSIFTVAVIETMIKDFDNLSFKDRNILADNWLNMTNPQKFAYREALGKMLQSNAQIIDNPKTQEQLKGLSQEAQNTQDRYNHTLKTFRELPEKEQIKWIEDIFGRKLSNTEISSGNLESIFIDAYFQPEAILNKQETNLANQLEKLKQLKNDSKTSQQTITQYNQAISNSANQTFDNRLLMDYIRNVSPSKRKTIPLETFKALDQSKKREILAEHVPGYMESKKEITKKSYNSPETLKTQISNIPIALAKANFSQKEIKEALTQYISTLKSFEKDDIENFNKWDIDIRKNQLNTFLIEDGMNEQIASILSKLNFNEKLFDILGNEEQRKEFFEQFDKVINQEYTQVKNEPLSSELEEILGQYFKSNAVDINVSAIEAQQKRTTEENQQNGQAQQAQENQQEPAVPPVVEENKPKEEGQPPKKDEEEKPTSAQNNSQNLPAKIGPIGLLFGGIRSILSRIKNKIFRKPEKRVQESKKDSKMGDSSAEQHSETPKKAQPSLDEQLKAGVDQSKFNKPIQQQAAPKKEDGQRTNDGEELEQGE